MTTLRVGIIGLGVGAQHIVGFERHPHCSVVALCDRDAQRLQAVHRQYPQMRLYEDAAELIAGSDVDVVCIASQDPDHFEQLKQTLQAGKIAFVEKPLCQTESQLREIRTLLNRHSPQKLGCNLILRLSPRLMELKRRIDADELGTLFYVEGDYNYGRLEKITQGWRGQIDFYSVVQGGAVHIIDVLMWLSQQKITEVSARGNRIASRASAFRFHDLVTSTLKFENDLVGKVSANFGCVVPHHHAFNIYGTKATYVQQYEGARLYRSRDPEAANETIETPHPGASKGDLAYAFIDSLISGGDPVISVDEIMDCMSVCLAIDKSAQTGRTVEVTYY